MSWRKRKISPSMPTFSKFSPAKITYQEKWKYSRFWLWLMTKKLSVLIIGISHSYAPKLFPKRRLSCISIILLTSNQFSSKRRILLRFLKCLSNCQANAGITNLCMIVSNWLWKACSNNQLQIITSTPKHSNSFSKRKQWRSKSRKSWKWLG